jgi:hypothetical protein
MHVEIKQQRRAFNGILKVGWAALFGNRNRKRGPVRAARSGARAPSASRGRGVPDGREGLLKMKAAAQGGTAVMNSSWEGPREGAAGAFYGARRPWGD